MVASIREYEPLAPLTTLGIGGPARYFIRANSETLIQQAVAFAEARKVPLLVLGGGSNLLVADEGFPGLVLRVELQGLTWIDENSCVRLVAGAGEGWDHVVALAVQRGLYGLECLSGIPGSVGGTPVQNVGAYGQEVSETIHCVRAYDRQNGRYVDLNHSACGFAYRSSVFNTTARERFIISQVEFHFSTEGEPALRYPELKRELEAVSNPTLDMVRTAVCRIRARKAMLIQPGDPDCRSVGSFFKNPVVDEDVFNRVTADAGVQPPRFPSSSGKIKIPAAWLIEQAGMSKGFSLGPAGISSKHTLAVINKGGATAEDVIKLAREIRRRVHDRFGIQLAVEPVFVGFNEDTISEFR